MIVHLHRFALPAAFSLLPARMDTPEARAMLLAIASQESRCGRRRQIQGPARGFWQFERTGVSGVMSHPSSKQHAAVAMESLQYRNATIAECHAAIEHNDVLAAVCARLLLWTLPQALPTRDEADKGWQMYFAAWRPGKPHPETWGAWYRRAWELVDGQPG